MQGSFAGVEGKGVGEGEGTSEQSPELSTSSEASSALLSSSVPPAPLSLLSSSVPPETLSFEVLFFKRLLFFMLDRLRARRISLYFGT